MFSLELNSSELDKKYPIASLKKGILADGFCFMPFGHIRIESVILYCPEKNLITFLVRECDQLAQPSESSYTSIPYPIEVNAVSYSNIIQTVKSWSLNAVYIECIFGDNWQITAERSQYASVPLYIAEHVSGLLIHWDPMVLAQHMNNIPLDLDFIAASLDHTSWTNHYQTYFKNTKRLQPNCRLIYNRQGMNLEIDPKPEMYVHDPVPGADLVSGFNEFLQAAIKRWVLPSDQFLSIELSGGLDSACVAFGLKNLNQGVLNSFGIISTGAIGKQQVERRSSAIDVLCAKDIRIQEEDETALAGDIQWDWHTHLNSMNGMYDALLSKNIDTIFTGHGGNELAPPSAISEPDNYKPTHAIIRKNGLESYKPIESPQGLLLGSTLQRVQSFSIFALRKGVWLASPFLEPHLVKYCCSLPTEWRNDRNFMQQYLMRQGLSKEWLRPELDENFNDYTEKSAKNILSNTLYFLNKSKLIELGVVDREALSGLIEATTSRLNVNNLYALHAFVEAERFLEWCYNKSEVVSAD